MTDFKIFVGGAGGYTGKGNYVVAVNAGETAVELKEVPVVPASPTTTKWLRDDGTWTVVAAATWGAYAAIAGPTQARTITLPDADTTVVGTTATQTLTNKAITKRVLQQVNNDSTMTSGNTNYNCDLCDVMEWTALAQDTDFAATGGTPYNGQTMTWIITGTAARALTFSGPFIAGGTTLALPTTTDTTKTLILQWMWMTILSTDSWVLVSKIESVTG